MDTQAGERKSPILPLLFLIVLLVVVGGAWYYVQDLNKTDGFESVAWVLPETDDTFLMEQPALQTVISEAYSKHDHIAQFRKAVKEKPGQIRNILNNTVKTLLNQKNYNALIDLYDLVVFEYPADENTCFNSLRDALRNKYKELFAFEKALTARIENEPHANHYKLASFAARNRRDIWLAAHYMSETIRRQENNQENYRMLADDYQRCRFMDRAVALHEKIKELSGDNFWYARFLGNRYAQMEDSGKFDKLITELTGSEELGMGQWQTLADLYCEVEDYGNALEYITKAYLDDSAKMNNRANYMIGTLAKALDGLGTYTLPEEFDEKISANERAVIMLHLAEHYTRMSKYLVDIGNYSANGRKRTRTTHHNFPAAARVIGNLEKSGLRIPDKQQFLYDRLKAMISHYYGDFPTALEYYGRQVNKTVPRNAIYSKARSRAVKQKTNVFIDFINRKYLPAGRGRISGGLRAYDKPLSGITVILRWRKDPDWKDYREQPWHPLQPSFQNNRQPPPPGIHAVTDKAGMFVLENLPAGSYDVTIMLDNAVINPEEPEVRHRFLVNPAEVRLRDGQRRELGWLDVVEPVEILEPETDYVAYDDTLRIAWDWKAPSHLKDYKFAIYIPNRFGPTVRSTAMVLNKEVGSKKYYDLDLDQIMPNSDLAIHISALSPVNQPLSSQSVSISYPKYNGLTSEKNLVSKALAREMMRDWNSRRYEEYIYRAEKLFNDFPDATIADDTLFTIASAWQKLNNKEMAEQTYNKFLETFPDSPLMPIRDRNYHRDYDVAAGYAQLTGGNSVEIREELDRNARRTRRSFKNNPNIQTSSLPAMAILSKALSWTFIILSCVLLIMIVQVVAVRKQ